MLALPLTGVLYSLELTSPKRIETKTIHEKNHRNYHHHFLIAAHS
jgi:hypothetical protein